MDTGRIETHEHDRTSGDDRPPRKPGGAQQNPGAGHIARSTKAGKKSTQGKKQRPLSSSVGGAFQHPNESIYYGNDVLAQNKPGNVNADGDHAHGHLAEGECAEITQFLVEALDALHGEEEWAKDESEFVIGAVLTGKGFVYVTHSGTVTAIFQRAIELAQRRTELPLVPVFTGGIGHCAIGAHENGASGLSKAQVASYANPHPSGDQDGPAFLNHPPDASDKDAEVTNGLPGTCALPKLIDHLIAMDDFPRNASERRYSPSGKPLIIKLHADAPPQRFEHGASVPSCITCRPMVEHQLTGMAESKRGLPERERMKAERERSAEEERVAREKLQDAAAESNRKASKAERERQAKIVDAMAGEAAQATMAKFTVFSPEEANETFLDGYEVWRDTYHGVVKQLLAGIPKLERDVEEAERVAAEAKRLQTADKAQQAARAEKARANLAEAIKEVEERLVPLEKLWLSLPVAVFDQETCELADWDWYDSPWERLTKALHALM